MIVLDLLPYDAILGFDWLQAHSPMKCDWKAKTLQFEYQGHTVQLQGLHPPLHLQTMPAKQVYKSSKGNDIWAFVMVDPPKPTNPVQNQHTTTVPQKLQELLDQYDDVFNDP
jgi:hypothetical protein